MSRLDRGGPRREIRSSPLLSDVDRSIVDNLHRIFQTRQGHSLSAPRCGVPDFSEAFRRDVDPSRRLCERLRAMIEEFEPRLYNVRVTRLDDASPGELRFEIRATVELADGPAAFRAETVMTSLDRFAVRR